MNGTAARAIDRPWLKEYPADVPADIDPEAFDSIKDILSQACERFAPKAAFTCMGKTLTFAELDRLARDFAAYLQNDLKLTRGDRVAVMMPNILQYPVAIFGILRAGYVVVNCNPLYTPRELEHQLKDSGAKAIIVVENFATTLEQCIAKTAVKHVITTQLGDLLGFPKSLIVNLVIKYQKKMVPAWNITGAVRFKDALAKGAASNYVKPAVAGSDIAFLQYTGGTTGV
ncbi:MAG: AMP-binding protein, partial [Burkholderiales bacterium]